MFGFLKKKIEDFASKITKKAEEKIEEAPTQPKEEPVPQPEPKKEERKPEPKKEKPAPKAKPTPPTPKPGVSPVPATPQVIEPEPAAPKVIEPEPEPEPAAPKVVEPEPVAPKVTEPVPAEPKPVVSPVPAIPPVAKPIEEKKPKLGLVTRIKRAVAAEVSLSEKEIDDFMWEFELALLEADVAQPVAEEIISLLKQRLAATKFSRGSDVRTVIESAVRDTIREIVSVPSFDLVEKAKKSEKPFVVMFLGPNGAGKTTTLAKIAHMLKENNLSSIFAASDTFRAASIEQLQYHADALGIKMVKHTYGADPAAVAFDTIKSAKARGIDCVLIDTAGRQETNKNLMEELKKIKRVANPHLLIYLDEALAGNALLERVEQFKAEIGVDGVILSKMDMDVKGGGVISIARSTGVPIIYYGIGQSYRDLVRFSADDLLDRIFG